jgi:hypothetical protein
MSLNPTGRHFYELTQQFVLPLDRFVTRLMPLKRDVSPFRPLPRFPDFHVDDFFASLREHLKVFLSNCNSFQRVLKITIFIYNFYSSIFIFPFSIFSFSIFTFFFRCCVGFFFFFFFFFCCCCCCFLKTQPRKGNWTALYSRFIESGNFRLWLKTRARAANNELLRLYLSTVCETDMQGELGRMAELKLMDLYIQIKQSMV